MTDSDQSTLNRWTNEAAVQGRTDTEEHKADDSLRDLEARAAKVATCLRVLRRLCSLSDAIRDDAYCPTHGKEGLVFEAGIFRFACGLDLGQAKFRLKTEAEELRRKAWDPMRLSTEERVAQEGNDL